MSLTRLQMVLISAWLTVIVLTLAATVVAGQPLTTSTLYLCALGCVPPVVLWFVFRGAPPQSIGQVLYETEHASTETARRLDAIRRSESER